MHQFVGRQDEECFMSKVVMYSTAVCPYCVRAEQLLTKKGVAEIEKIRIDLDPERFEEMMTLSQGRRTVPQIFIGETHVGGYDDLVDLDMDGELMPLLEA
jgi:glutaredoxin 3